MRGERFFAHHNWPLLCRHSIPRGKWRAKKEKTPHPFLKSVLSLLPATVLHLLLLLVSLFCEQRSLRHRPPPSSPSRPSGKPLLCCREEEEEEEGDLPLSNFRREERALQGFRKRGTRRREDRGQSLLVSILLSSSEGFKYGGGTLVSQSGGIWWMPRPSSET